MADAAYRSILAAQRIWAETSRTEIDEDGHVSRWQDNLFGPLDARSRSELEASAGRPFGDADKPGPLHALHSTLALCVSFFGYWRDRDASPLSSALGLGEAPCDIRFARKHACSEPDHEVEIDLEIEPVDGPPIAVWSSYAEPHGQIDSRLPVHLRADRAFTGRLPGCRGLAEDVRVNPGRYRRLAVGRLLECVDALVRSHGPRGFRLLVLWHDPPTSSSRELQSELSRLRARIGGEVRLDFRTWRQLVGRIASNHAEHVAYTQYLESRYLLRA
jgi:hypothetical protein